MSNDEVQEVDLLQSDPQNSIFVQGTNIHSLQDFLVP